MTSSKDRVQRRAGRRPWWRRLVALVVALALLALVLPGLLAGNLIRSRLESLAGEALGAEVVIEGLSAGWWSDLEVDRLLLHERGSDSPILFEAGAARLSSGIWGLLFGDDVLRLTLEEPTLRLRGTSGGGLNAAEFANRLPARSSGAADAPLSLPGRGAEIAIRGGRIVLGEGAVQETYGFDGGVSCDDLAVEPMRFRLELSRTAGGRAVIGGEVSAWQGEGASELTGSVDATDLDLSTLNTVLSAATGMRAVGSIERLTMLAEPRGEGTRFVVEGGLLGVGVSGEERPIEEVLERVDLRLGAFHEAGGVREIAGSISVPGGVATIERESHASWDTDGVSGLVQLDCNITDLAPLSESLRGLIPEGVDLAGRGVARARVAGTWARRELSWTNRLRSLQADVAVSIDDLGLRGTAIRDLKIGGTLDNGVLELKETRGKVGGGEVRVVGTLPLTEEREGARLQWDIAPRVTLQQPIQDAGRVSMVLHGAGDVALRSGRVRLGGDLGIDLLSVHDVPSVPLHLKDGRLRFDITADPDTGRIELTDLHLKEPKVDVRVQQGVLEERDGIRRASGSVTARLGEGFLGKLVPDVGFEGPVTVTGDFATDLSDPRGTARCDATMVTGGLSYDFHRVEQCTLRIEKRGEVLSIPTLDVRVDGGHVEGSGRVHMGGMRPADRLALSLRDVRLDRPLAEGALKISGVISGELAVEGSTTGAAMTVKAGVTSPMLSGKGVRATALERLDFDGRIGWSESGDVTIADLKVGGEGVSAEVSSMHLPAEGAEPVSVRARADATGTLVQTLLSPWIPQGIVFERSMRLEVDGTIGRDRPLESATGRLRVALSGVSVNRRRLRNVKLGLDVANGRVVLRETRAESGQGTATLTGEFGLIKARRRVGDRVMLELDGFPVTVDQHFPAAASGVSRRISTGAILSGRGTASVVRPGRIDIEGAIDVREVGRHFVVGSAAPESIAIPDSRVTIAGAWLDDGIVIIDRAELVGVEARVTIADLRQDARGLRFSAVEANVPPAWVSAVLLGEDGWRFSPTRPLRIELGNVRAPRGEDGGVELGGLKGTGRLRLEECAIGRLRVADVDLSCEIRDGALRVQKGEAVVSGGRLTVAPSTQVGLGPEIFPFRLKAALAGARLNEAFRTPLGVLNPILLGRQRSSDAALVGSFDGEVDVSGAWSSERGWSKTANGTGRVRLADVKVSSSSVLLGLATRADSVLRGSAARTLFDVLGQGSAVGRFLRPLTTSGYGFKTFESDLAVRDGRVHLRDGVSVQSEALSLTVSGWGSLEGDLSYRVDTDVVKRLRRFAEERLRERVGGGLLGGLLGALNPLTMALDIELGATVSGNAFEGLPKVDVSLMKARAK